MSTRWQQSIMKGSDKASGSCQPAGSLQTSKERVACSEQSLAFWTQLIKVGKSSSSMNLKTSQPRRGDSERGKKLQSLAVNREWYEWVPTFSCGYEMQTQLCMQSQLPAWFNWNPVFSSQFHSVLPSWVIWDQLLSINGHYYNAHIRHSSNHLGSEF